VSVVRKTLEVIALKFPFVWSVVAIQCRPDQLAKSFLPPLFSLNRPADIPVDIPVRSNFGYCLSPIGPLARTGILGVINPYSKDN